MTTTPHPPPTETQATSAAIVTDRRTPGGLQAAILLAASCMPVLGVVLIAPVIPALQAAYSGVAGVTVLAPIVLTVPALVIAVTAPLAGMLADRVDRRRLLAWALVAYAVAGTAPLYLQGLPAIIGSRILVGIFEAAIITCATSLIGDYWTGTRRSRYLGLQTLVTSLAAAVFLAVGGAVGTLGWRAPFALYLIALLLVPAALRMLPSATADLSGRPSARPDLRVLVAPLVVTFFGGLVYYALIVELPFVLTGIGVTSSSAIGLISAVMTLATAVGSVLFTRVASRSPRLLLPLEFVVAAAGLLLVFAGSSPVLVTVGSVLSGLGTGMLLPTLLTWVANRLTPETRGRGTGLFTGALFVGQFVSPLAITAVAVAVGGLQPALAVLAGATLVLAAVVGLALRRTHEPLDRTPDA